MAHEYFTTTNIEFTETQFLRDVANAISDAIQNLVELSDDLNQLDLQDVVEKGAHLEAINFITARAEDMITNAFMSALFSSVEYNHELFVGRSQEAVTMHWREILIVKATSPGHVFVETNFEILGDIESYAAAVGQAREALGFKMTTSPESRSIYWARNIYGVDREGRTVKATPAGHKKSKDVTANYLGKWIKTVSTRLGFIASGQAPWWYLINYGNQDAFNESSGTPYPVVQPTHFVEVLEAQVLDIFIRIYRESLQKWGEWYADAIADDYGLKDFDNPDEVLRVVEPKIAEQIEKREVLEPASRTIGLIKQDSKTWELYISAGGRISRRYSLSKN
jgi:hypothetical protein